MFDLSWMEQGQGAKEQGKRINKIQRLGFYYVDHIKQKPVRSSVFKLFAISLAISK